MKYFGLAAAALMMTIGASAATVTELCGTFSNGNPTTTQTGTITCNAFSTLGTGGTVTGAFLVYASDYSNGIFASQTAVTTYTFSGATLANGADTVTTSGSSSSAGEVSGDGAPFQAANSPALAGFYDNVTAGVGNQISAAYNNQMTVGNAIATTGYVQEIFTYTPGGTTPEPGSLMLLGSGLVAFAIAGRKLVRK